LPRTTEHNHTTGIFNSQPGPYRVFVDNVDYLLSSVALWGMPAFMTSTDIHFNLPHPDPAVVDALVRSLGCHRAVAIVMANRGIQSETDAQTFLFANLRNLAPPFDMADMAPAVQRIADAIEKKEKILVFGDYDVDGITASLVLGSILRAAGHTALVHIPHRIEEGYGLKPTHVTDLARSSGAGLIITVDCGSSSHDAIEAADGCGIDVVVTDHHRVPPPLPGALALVNPMRSDCHAGFESLAGVGVAFQLAVCLRSHLRDKGFWRNRPEPDLRALLDLVALGTVADMVPMRNDNRILTRAGLRVINQGLRPGLASLVDSCGLEPGQVTATDIAFRLAPRLNAAGRIGHASLAYDLLSVEDASTAGQISQALNRMNSQRQALENDVMEQIRQRIDREPELLDGKSLVMADESWHPGVLGIVASRLSRNHGRPTVLIALRDGLGKGSGRSIPGVDLHGCLADCESHLEAFGGHAQAAGLTIRRERIDEFRIDFETAISKAALPETFIRRIDLDCELDLPALTLSFVDEMGRLGPFGTDNPDPVFLARNLDVVDCQIVGGRHRKMTFRQGEGPSAPTASAIAFNVDLSETVAGRFSRVAFRLNINRWNGRQRVQMIVEEMEKTTREAFY
jgi:single-stranded-DNA-specific exonuclease